MACRDTVGLLGWTLLLCLGAAAAPTRAASPVLITEFSAAGHQGWRDEDGDTPDWIELQNVSNESVDLNGWVLTESAHRARAWTFPATNLPPSRFLTVFASGKDRRVPGRPLHTNFKLPAKGGGLRLSGPGGQTAGLDHYPPQVEGVSFGLVRAGQSSNAVPSPGAFSYLIAPTPGRSNAVPVSLGPWIEAVDYQPARPGVDQPIVVTAKVISAGSPVAKVRLSYRVMFGPDQELAMADDGQHGDGAASDGVYGAIIPAKTAQPGQLVRYSISCHDEAGQVSRWPLFAARPEYSAYQGLIIAEELATRLPVCHLFIGREPAPDARGNAATACIGFEGEVYDQVRLRGHGQFSRMFPKRSYNVRFPRDHACQYRSDRPAVRKLKLISNYADKSKIRNTLAYEMIAASGSLGHFAFPVRVQKNGKFFSVAEMVENGDEQWLERIGRDPQGALYKMDNNLSGARGAEKKTRRYESNRDLANFAAALSEQRPIEERAAYAYDNIDIPQCISYFVAMALISSDDHGHKNYYLYRDSRHTGEWALLPWDVDLSWGRDWTGDYFNESIFIDNPLDFYRSDRHKSRNRLYDLFFRYPEFRQMYLRRLRTVMDQLLQPPGTPAKSLIIEQRIRELMDQIDPPGIKPSDADLDAAWPSWGQHSSMRKEATRIMTEYLPGRRQFLFKSSRAKLFGEAIPAAQPPNATLDFDRISLSPAAPGQFLCLTNRNAFAVDVTGWRVTGGGMEHRFRPGTVLPAGKSLYVAADVAQFRKNQGVDQVPLFVQGNWTGRLRNGDGPVRLVNEAGDTVSSRELHADASQEKQK